MSVYIMSDPHYAHQNIVRGVSEWEDKSRCRDFDTVEQMNETIISNINSLVKEEDEIICAGDWSFGGVENIFKFRHRINCRNIGLIRGNHDRARDTRLESGILAYGCFSFYVDYLELTHKGSKLVIFHYPIASWNGMSRGSIHLHAHTHRSPEDKYMNGGRSMDVGLDGNNLMPYSLDDIVEDLKKRPVKREGHHS